VAVFDFRNSSVHDCRHHSLRASNALSAPPRVRFPPFAVVLEFLTVAGRGIGGFVRRARSAQKRPDRPQPLKKREHARLHIRAGFPGKRKDGGRQNEYGIIAKTVRPSPTIIHSRALSFSSFLELHCRSTPPVWTRPTGVRGAFAGKLAGRGEAVWNQHLLSVDEHADHHAIPTRFHRFVRVVANHSIRPPGRVVTAFSWMFCFLRSHALPTCGIVPPAGFCHLHRPDSRGRRSGAGAALASRFARLGVLSFRSGFCGP